VTSILTERDHAAPLPGAGNKVPWWKREYHIGRAVSPEEVMNFSRQAASFLRAGIPILDALTVFAEDNANRKMVEVLDDVRRSLRSGSSFAGALARHRRVFPDYYVSMVRSAELTGRLDDVLDQLASYMERDLDARRRIKSALTYPTVVVVMAIMAVIVLAGWVLPKFQGLFDELDADLPLTTRILLGFTDFVSAAWPFIVATVVGIVVMAFGIIGGGWGKRRRDGMLLRLPAFGELLRFIVVERFCRVLSAMVRAGVPLPDALSVASDSTNNRVFQEKLTVVREEMVRGSGLARPLAESGLFPAAVKQMVRVGEGTGTLDQQLESAAGFYERELGYRLKRFTDLFEPVIILVVGFIVGFIALALVQAMYGVFDQVEV
jgi:type IV pilus assembly protein PilC